MDNSDEIFDNILNQLNEIKNINLNMIDKLKISENKIQNIIDNLTIINNTYDTCNINDTNDVNTNNDIYKLKLIYNNDFIDTKIINNDINESNNIVIISDI